MQTGEKTRVAAVLQQLCAELVDGVAGNAYMLNSGDSGLLRSLERLSAADASDSVNDGAPVCAHVDHLRYGLSLLNRWSAGEDPFTDADWSASWKVTRVSEREWEGLRLRLAEQAHAWRDVLTNVDVDKEGAMETVIAAVAHLAYHMGAIRQIAPTSRGPAQ